MLDMAKVRSVEEYIVVGGVCACILMSPWKPLR